MLSYKRVCFEKDSEYEISRALAKRKGEGMKEENRSGLSDLHFPVLFSSVSGKRERLAVEAEWHDYDELIYFQEGEFQLYLNLKEKLIKEECLYFIPKGCFHRIYATSDKAVEHSLCFNLKDFRFLENDFVEQKFFAPLREEKHFFPEEISLNDMGFIDAVQSFSRMVQYFHKHGLREESIESCKKYSLRGLADHMHMRAEMLHLFATMEGMGLIREKSPTEEGNKAELLKECILYMEEHYKEKLYIHNLSSLCRLNEQYFTRFFGNHVGLPPLEYLNRYRVKKATDLMIKTEEKIVDIAKNTGFHNQGNFIKTFKTIMGETPNQYRKRMLG